MKNYKMTAEDKKILKKLFDEKFNSWEELTKPQWVELLSEFPQYAKYCKIFEDFYITHWKDLLSKQVCFADMCDVLFMFSVQDWIEILCCQSSLIDRCDKVKYFNPKVWLQLLDTGDDYLLENAKKWVRGWLAILSKFPQLETQCDKWDLFSINEVEALLSVNADLIYKSYKCKKFDFLEYIHTTRQQTAQTTSKLVAFKKYAKDKYFLKKKDLSYLFAADEFVVSGRNVGWIVYYKKESRNVALIIRRGRLIYKVCLLQECNRGGYALSFTEYPASAKTLGLMHADCMPPTYDTAIEKLRNIADDYY